MPPFKIVILAVCYSFVSICGATTYFISPSGNDSNSGTSQAKAWKTVYAIYKVKFKPGDSVLLEGGKAFAGGLYFADSASPEHPITISSYGTGRATLMPYKNESGIYIYNAAAYHISRLIIEGDTASKVGGIFFYMNKLKDKKLKDISIDNVEIKNFGGSGLVIGSYPADTSRSGYEDIRITRSIAHHNQGSGILIWGHYAWDDNDPADTLYAHQNVLIDHCTTYDNGGSGIQISELDSGLVQYCESYHNGLINGGIVGIWTFDANHVIIQYCESHHNKSTGTDGDGFDLDGGVRNSIMQYNYSHDNDGAGYLVWQYDYARPMRNNVVRYNISENDSREQGGYYGIVAIGMQDMPYNSGTHDIYVYNNTFYKKRRTGDSTHQGAAVSLSGKKHTGIHIFNNVFVLDSTSRFVTLYDTGGISFRNNVYYGNQGFWATNGNTEYHSLKDWQAGTNHEMHNGKSAAMQINPRLKKTGNSGTLADPESMPALLSGYQLQSASSIAGKGINSDSISPFSVMYDFFNDTLHPLHVFTPGAHEPQPVHFTPTVAFNASDVCFGNNVQFANATKRSSVVSWSFGDGDSSGIFSPKHVYRLPGIYTVTLRATSIYGKQSVLKKSVRVFALPDAQWTVKNSGLLAEFSADDTALSSYKWQFGDTDSAISAISLHYYMSDGSYNVKLLVTDSNGCSSEHMDTFYMKSGISAIEYDSITPKLYCKGELFSLKFKANYQARMDNRFTVYLSDSAGQAVVLLDTLNNSVFNIFTLKLPVTANPGTYSILVKGSNPATKALDTAKLPQITISNDSLPRVQYSTNLKNGAICFGDTLKINVSGANAYNFYKTSQPNDTFSSKPYYAEKLTTASHYIIRFRSKDGCLSSSPEIIPVLMPLPLVKLTATDTKVCEDQGTELQFTGSISYDIYSDHQELIAADITKNMYTLAAPLKQGTYQVWGTDLNGCSDSSNDVNIQVNSSPEKPLISRIGQLLKSSYDHNNQWLKNGVKIPDTGQFFSPAVEGVYSVMYNDSNGCTNMSDTYGFHFTSVSDIRSGPVFTIYPNPASKELLIDNHNDMTYLYRLYDAYGRIVQSDILASGTKVLDIEGLSSGTYILVVMSGEMEQRFRVVVLD